MSSAEYSFIDIAALDPVRAHFVAGEAVAVLSADLDEVVWANGPGAALFGHETIESILGGAAGLTGAQRRQIAATPGFPYVGTDRPIVLRLTTGFGRRAVLVKASQLALPDGAPAIMLHAPGDGTDGADAAARAIAGFGGDGHFAALVRADGSTVASTQGFEALGIEASALAEAARGRVVKRLIRAGARRLPMGMSRVADEPPLHFVLVVDDGRAAEEPVSEPTAEKTQPVASEPVADAGAEARSGDGSDDWYFDSAAKEAIEGADGGSGPAEAPSSSRRLAPVRFVWRTDADGRFSAMSEEFLAAVGLHFEDVVGRSFRDVARDFRFDETGEIAALLERRDTWSGRSVLWPVEGETRLVPVDLAALPTYARDRSFEGFRGFGVARVADAVEAPPAPQVTQPAEPAASEEPVARILEDDPFEGEVPALVVLPKPLRRSTDKVVRLAEHRPQTEAAGLSSLERSAFREIGDRLKEFASAPRPERATEPADAVIAVPADERADFDSNVADLATLFDYEESGGADEEGVAGGDAWQPSDRLELPDDLDPFETAERAPSLVRVPEAPRMPAEPPADEEDHQPRAAPTDEDDILRADDGLAIMARLPLPLLIHSGDTLHFANREFLSLTGYDTLDELAEAGGIDALIAGAYPHEGDEEPSAPARRRLRIVTASGEEFAAEGHLQSVPWNGGKALLLALRTVEIDEDEAERDPRDYDLLLRKAEAMRERVIEMQTIVDTATDGLVLLSNDAVIRSISRPAEALFGYNSDELTGKPFISLLAVESHRGTMEYLAGLAENGVASILNDGREVIGRESQGRFIPLFMTIARLPDRSGFCVVLRDITQWKRAEEELTQARAQAERSSSQKTDFLARISHEIRTPLNAIIGFSELMMAEKFGPIGSERYRDYLRDINRSGNHVLDLVNDLLDITKIEAGEQEMSYEAVSLNDTLAEMVAMMQPQANRERVIIRSSFAQRLPEIVADQRSIRQIALNLLSNAVRYTPAGGQVIVSTAHEASGDVVMRVRDTGVGMTPAEIEQAMKPFKQINALKRPRGDGTGLGLPLTKAMVEANRARFQINSTPGEGTLVEIVFPSTRVLAG